MLYYIYIHFFLDSLPIVIVQSLSHVWPLVTPWTAARQASLSFTVCWSLPKLMSTESVMPSVISFSVAPSPLALNLSQHQGLFKWANSWHQVAKVWEVQFQHQSFQWIFRVDFLKDWLVWSPCSPGDSQESSPALQFERINSSALCLLYGPTLTSIHDYHSLNYTDLCGKMMSLLFNMLSRFIILSFQGASIF